ncbi:MAG: hypothetical protein H6Q20_2434 [Bacteroidetes bacterium]|nr:hypothetical protein [Bacteroidota bacterium]
MLCNFIWYELLGFAGSILLAISLIMNSINKLRLYSLIGALVFSVYGFAIGVPLVGLLNAFIVCVDIYYLIKIHSANAAFKAIEVQASDPYLNYFIQYHIKDIKAFFPGFDDSVLTDEDGKKNLLVFLLLKDAAVAGVLIGVKNNHILYVHLDYVTIEYRDLGSGEFFYKTNVKSLKEKGIQQIISKTEDKAHIKYLKKMGFDLQPNSRKVYVKNIST